MSTTPVVVDPNAAAPQAAPPTSDSAGNWWEIPEPATPAEPQTPPAAAPQAPPSAPQYFLRAETGTVYKTSEEAARGVAEKDRMIAQQRTDLERAQQLLAASGIRLDSQQAAPPQAPNEPDIYSFLEQDIRAVQSGKPNPRMFQKALAQQFEQLAQERSQAYIQPFMPLVEHAALSQAMETAAQQFDPNIPAFVRSPAYAKTLEQRPSLKTAIQTAISYPHYQTADGTTFGTLLPELLSNVYLVAKAAAPAAQTVQRPAPASTTPPQFVRSGAPQGPAPTEPARVGFPRDPFMEAWNNVPDIPLTKESLGG